MHNSLPLAICDKLTTVIRAIYRCLYINYIFMYMYINKNKNAIHWVKL